jgi:hypothetical protein
MVMSYLLWMRTGLEYIRDEVNERALARELAARPQAMAHEPGPIEQRRSR